MAKSHQKSGSNSRGVVPLANRPTTDEIPSNPPQRFRDLQQNSPAENGEDSWGHGESKIPQKQISPLAGECTCYIMLP